MSCSGSFTCIEKALPSYQYATQAQKFPTCLRLSTNTLAQKSTRWPLPKFEEPPIIILCQTTISRQIFTWIKLHKNCENDWGKELNTKESWYKSNFIVVGSNFISRCYNTQAKKIVLLTWILIRKEDFGSSYKNLQKKSLAEWGEKKERSSLIHETIFLIL